MSGLKAQSLGPCRWINTAKLLKGNSTWFVFETRTENQKLAQTCEQEKDGDCGVLDYKFSRGNTGGNQTKR